MGQRCWFRAEEALVHGGEPMAGNSSIAPPDGNVMSIAIHSTRLSVLESQKVFSKWPDKGGT